MSIIDVTRGIWEMNRSRTLATLDEIAAHPEAEKILGWRPGPGRAHIAWQLMHVAITEELFATARLFGAEPHFAELIDRFRGGSTPDDQIPTVNQIREVLNASRSHLMENMQRISDADLDQIPEALAERGWTIGTALKILAWHEPHHQGQAHITWNLWKASHA